MIGPARLSCRSGVGRSGASRSGALLTVTDAVADVQIEGGVSSDGGWASSLTDDFRRRGNTVGEGPATGWVVQ